MKHLAVAFLGFMLLSCAGTGNFAYEGADSDAADIDLEGEEISAEQCQDSLDNDGDGFADCEDYACQVYVFCVGETSCASDSCDENATCDDSAGIVLCHCNDGWMGDGFICSDMDECDLGDDLCDQNCANSDGSYSCSCNAGWTLNEDGYGCDDIDECSTGSDNCDDVNGTCINSDGSFGCGCSDGYALNVDGHTCDDIDECALGAHNCDLLRGSCANTDGGFACGCTGGWVLSGDGRTCDNVDECAAGLDNCDSTHGTCNDVEGSYVCDCVQGYALNADGHTCDNIDECTIGSDNCDSANGTCADTDGGFACGCNTGWALNVDGFTCDNVDECSAGSDDCDATNGNCTDIAGGFTCGCNTGYALNADGHTCDNVDECVLGTDNCDLMRGTCIDTDGGFTCGCNAGWVLNADGRSCDNVDECSAGTDNCDTVGGTCTDTAGNFLCGCVSGYELNADGHTCDNVDECALGTDNCDDQVGTCTDADGGFTCGCNAGWSLNADGQTCDNVDECGAGTDNCDAANGTCTDTPGTFACGCVAGYELNADGHTCDNIDECALGLDDCAAVGGACEDTPGGYTCGCLMYVDQVATGSETGLSWTDAFVHVKDALSAAQAVATVDNPCRIWVADGVYYVYESDRTDTVQMVPFVDLYGGFNGTETAFAERDWHANLTVLSGWDGPVQTVQVYHVVTSEDDARIDGFLITGGNANGPNPHERGGGIFNRHSSPAISNCTFVDNKADVVGGAIRIDGSESAPVITDSLFFDNEAGVNGGGVGNGNGTNATYERCVFVNNYSAGRGGGMNTGAGAVVVRDSLFVDNAAATHGGGFNCFNCTATVENSIIAGNFAAEGAGMKIEHDGNTEFSNTVVAGNIATNNGGGVFFFNRQYPRFTNTLFVDNSASQGGAVRADSSSSPEFYNSIFLGNLADTIYDSGGSVTTVEHSRILSVAGNGNITADPGLRGYPMTAGNTWTAVAYDPATFQTVLTDDTADWIPGDLEGLFVKPDAANDDRWTYVVSNTQSEIRVWGNLAGFVGVGELYELYDLHLSADSPCIDAADGSFAPDFDLEYNQRVDDPSIPDSGIGIPDYVDMGVYENMEFTTDTDADTDTEFDTDTSSDIDTDTGSGGDGSTLSVTEPNGGESWVVGSTNDITWTSSGGITEVKLEYSVNNGGSWSTITSSTSNDGFYTWTVPSSLPPSTEVLVRISDAYDLLPYDESDGTFTFAAITDDGYEVNDTLLQAYPVSYGETIDAVLTTASAEDWFSFDATAGESIRLSVPLDQIVDPIEDIQFSLYDSAGAYLSGDYAWGDEEGVLTHLIPSTGTYYLQFAQFFGNAFGDYQFTVQQGSAGGETLSLVSPNGGESWVVGSTNDITWTSSGGITEVKLEYSVNNGGSWSTIRTSTSNDGLYTWTVPSSLPPSTEVLVRISDAYDLLPYDESDGTFTFAAIADDGYEVNDTLLQAYPVSYGETIDAVLTTASAEDWFSFDATAGESIRLSVPLDQIVDPIEDIQFSLYDSAGGYLAGGYAWGVEEGILTHLIPSTGTYYLQFLPLFGDAFGNYQFTAQQGTAAGETLSLVSPNGGESWVVGSTNDITWTSSGGITEVKLEYSVNNGGSWSTIRTSTSNDGLYTWTVPSSLPPSTEVLVRISDAYDLLPYDESDGTFTFAAIADDGYEVNDTLLQAYPVSYGETIDAVLTTASAEDWFSFDATAGESIRLSVPLDQIVDPIEDIQFSLYDSAGGYLAGGYAWGVEEGILTHLIPSTGTYYLQFLPLFGDAFGNYQFTVIQGVP